MLDNNMITPSRKQIYNEIWEISVAGVARKHDIPYSRLMKVCKESNIPIPSSGYWTKLEFGKVAEKTELSESDLEDLVFPVGSIQKRQSQKKVIVPSVQKTDVNERPAIKIQSIVPMDQSAEQTSITEETNVVSASDSEQEPYREVEGITNTYDRQRKRRIGTIQLLPVKMNTLVNGNTKKMKNLKP